jgi:hypothetical protein
MKTNNTYKNNYLKSWAMGSLIIAASAWTYADNTPNSTSEKITLDRSVEQHLANTVTQKGWVHSSLMDCNFIHEDGHVSPVLLDFLRLFNIKHDGSVASINEAMQKHFLRKSGLERWDLADTEKDKKLRPQALPLLKQMGMVDAIPAQPAAVDYFLLFGATLETMEARFKDFLAQHKAGTLPCKKLVFLGGARKLTKNELEKLRKVLAKNFKGFLKEINKKEARLVETDLWHFLWKTKAPKAMKQQYSEEKGNVIFVNATEVSLGKNNRPTTDATLDEWITTYQPTPGSCHGNVEKPYSIRMEKVLRLKLEQYNRTLPTGSNHFSISWNSPAASNNLSLAVYKDELARAFYQEYLLKEYLATLQA